MKRIALCCIVILWVLQAAAQQPAKLPSFYRSASGSPVSDFAGIFTAGELEAMNSDLSRYFSASGNVIVVITITSLYDSLSQQLYTVDEAALLFFNRWKPGTRRKNDAVMLLVALKERKVRIALGKAYNRSVYDPVCSRILSDDIVPAFRQGLYTDGIKKAAAAFKEKLFRRP